MDQHLSEVRLVTDGQSIFKICRRDGEVMDALRDGQMAFFVAIDDIATGVETNVRQFEEDREKFVRALREAAAHTATGTLGADAPGSGPPVRPPTRWPDPARLPQAPSAPRPRPAWPRRASSGCGLPRRVGGIGGQPGEPVQVRRPGSGSARPAIRARYSSSVWPGAAAKPSSPARSVNTS